MKSNTLLSLCFFSEKETSVAVLITSTAYRKSSCSRLCSFFRYACHIELLSVIIFIRKQIVSLKTGTHTIAVKVVDNDGLENIETVKLKINGIVEQL
ncbi:MAG: hypothetical protein LBO67_09295 [Spirochaetaceae bacterium]|nr:hypothetical protein [Spirochaetaceae bacterium]